MPKISFLTDGGENGGKDVHLIVCLGGGDALGDGWRTDDERTISVGKNIVVAGDDDGGIAHSASGIGPAEELAQAAVGIVDALEVVVAILRKVLS